MGVADSWDLSAAISSKQSFYLSSTWSPCSQLIAVVTQEAIEIQDALSLKLLSTLHSSKVGAKFRQGLAYSPDGLSLACCSDASVSIWDTQTGGIITKIECEVPGNGLELVWSLDGERICTVSSILQTFTICIYEVSSRTKLSCSTLQSESEAYCWAHNEAFRIITTAQVHKGWTISIFEIGNTATRIQSFPFQFTSPIQAFSPTTYRVLTSAQRGYNHDPKLVVVDIQSSNVLLETTCSYGGSAFSPDASLLAAFTQDQLLVWKYSSGHYTQWREFQQTPMPLQFSPNLSSILGCDSVLVHTFHLDYSSATPTEAAAAAGIPKDAYSPDSTYIATTDCGRSVITITNLHPQVPFPSQVIQTEFKISEIVLTGNVLLVKGPNTVAAWLLTKEGVVNGITGGRVADCNDSIWRIPPQQDKNPSFLSRLLRQDHSSHSSSEEHLEFSNLDGVAVIRQRNGFYNHVYHTETGEILKMDKAPSHQKRTWYRFNNPHRDDCSLYHHDLPKHHEPFSGDWQISQSTLQEGWVKDPEGRHRLWLRPSWRSTGNDISWLNHVTTLRLKNSSELVVVKF